MLTDLSPEAEALGAVNTLVRTPSGWKGHNTDIWGFSVPFNPSDEWHERALVLGTGGSAAAVHHGCATWH